MKGHTTTLIALALGRVRKKCLLLAVVLSLALCSVLALAQMGASYFSQDSFRLSIGLVSLDDNPLMGQLTQLVLNTPEIRQSYNIIPLDSQEEGVAQVEDNRIYGCIVLPDDFLYSLQTGQNYPPTVILNSTQTADARVTVALCQILSEMMRQTQSGIYASTDFVLAADSYDDEFYLDSNMAYLTYVLDRSETFLSTDLPYESVLDLPTHYGLTLSIFLLLLSTPLFYDMMNIRRDLLSMKLMAVRSNCHQTLYFIQLGVIFVLYLLLFFVLCLAFGGAFSPLTICSVVNATGLFVLTQALLFHLVPHYLPAMLLALFLNSLALVASGGIIPSLLLPPWVATLSNLFPLTHIRTLLSSTLVTVDRLPLYQLIILSANWLLSSLLYHGNSSILVQKGGYSRDNG